jgi:hypothetical protein
MHFNDLGFDVYDIEASILSKSNGDRLQTVVGRFSQEAVTNALLDCGACTTKMLNDVPVYSWDAGIRANLTVWLGLPSHVAAIDGSMMWAESKANIASILQLTTGGGARAIS